MSKADTFDPAVEQSINRLYLADEADVLEVLLPLARSEVRAAAAIQRTATDLAATVRASRREAGGLQAFLNHYDLSSAEGIVLMCLAEALLRIPDSATVDALIADKLAGADWRRHLGDSDSLFVNASTWALMLTGKVLRRDQLVSNDPVDLLGKLVARLEEPILRASLKAAMGIMAAEFVMGRSIFDALERARSKPFLDYRFSFDMLGEAALTRAAADDYQNSYMQAIAAIGDSVAGDSGAAGPGISVKLSALCPRFEMNHRERAVGELSERLHVLAAAACSAGIALTLDAEEADRLEMTLRVFERVAAEAALSGWSGLGIAVQAYQKRALDVLRWLNGLGRERGRIIPLRLVKGAYWDSEIKLAQMQGLADYSVFTLKQNTDVSYLACARFMLAECDALYPQFATHNAHTVSYLHHHAGAREIEFQRLHGMGQALYRAVTGSSGLARPCRIYAPVGAHEDLLPYLVRRLLENGANTSFVNRLVHDETAIESLVADPVSRIEISGLQRHPRIPLPRDLYQPERVNSAGVNFGDRGALELLFASIEALGSEPGEAAPIIGGERQDGTARIVLNPARHDQCIGTVHDADSAAALAALDLAASSFEDWRRTAAQDRAAMLDRAADHFETRVAELVALCVLESGKTIPDGVAEVREAIDFLRYYAAECRTHFDGRTELRGPTGEANELGLIGRGVFVCISPWNFPVAIYTGQVAAALAAGNTVIAKPAEQTSLVAWRATQLLFEAGVPSQVLSFLPGDGAGLGAVLLGDRRVSGVAFTGSTETARAINRTLAGRDGGLPAVIAETGGINAMIVDSSALPEQVVRDVMSSAFNCAGQRCSALRVLCLQAEIAERVLELLFGFMDEWVVGDPARLDTDMGPVIDAEAKAELDRYIDPSGHAGKILYRGLEPALDGYFVPPTIIEVQAISDVTREVFGPVLHVLRYEAEVLPRLLDDINALGYGLTVGIQSRIEHRARSIRDQIRAGNVYVNRNMIGAVVGTQPFGGLGLSGTGPKAGGPNYLKRFAAEQTYTVNTVAVGGNATLLTTGPDS